MSSEKEPILLEEKERTRCEIWSRVMGYYRPVSAWNTGKQSEFADRRAFREPPAAKMESSGQMKLGL